MQGSSSGAKCLTGDKVYCCHSTVGSVSSGLKSNPQLTRYAASWEQLQDTYAAIWEQRQGPLWAARHGLTSAQYQREVDRLGGQGYRLVDVSGYTVGGEDRFAAIWEQRQSPPWAARHGLTSTQYQQEVDRLGGQGYRLVHVNGYAVADQDFYAAIWEQRQGPAWAARHGLTSEQYQQEVDRLGGQGYRLVDVSGYTIGGQDRYAAIWEQRQGPAWAARHGLTAEQYQQEVDTLTQQGYRLSRISAWRSGNMPHYAAIWEKVEGPAWVARHGMLSDAYQEEVDKLLKEGYRLKHVCGYHTYD